MSAVACLIVHQSLEAQILSFHRFESDSGFENDSIGNATLSEIGPVEQLSLTNQGAGAHFPTGLLGIGANRSAAKSVGQVSGFISDNTMTVNDAFTIELFANFENLDPSASRSVLAAQAEFPCCPTWQDGFSWSFSVERVGASYPGGTSRPRELEVFASDGTDIWLFPSGIFLEENTDYYLSASFDLNAELRFIVQDLSAGETQVANVPHSFNSLHAHATLGVMWPQGFARVEGVLDEVRFSRGFVPESELMINNFAEAGDFNIDGVLDIDDVDLLLPHVADEVYDRLLDANRDGLVNREDLTAWIHDLRDTWFGDANLDGEFNSSDLVSVFKAGQYEDGVLGGSTWATGDWNGDHEFDTSDLVAAFQDGGYENGPRTAVSSVPEPSSILLIISGLAFLAGRRK